MLIRSITITQNAMDKKFSIRQFPSPEHPYIAFPQKNLAVLDISRFTTVEIGPQSRLLYKAAVSLCVCLQLIRYSNFSTQPSDRKQIWHTYSDRYGTHSQLKKLYPPHPRGGARGILGGQYKSGKCHELPRKSIKKLSPGGGGWKL